MCVRSSKKEISFRILNFNTIDNLFLPPLFAETSPRYFKDLPGFPINLPEKIFPLLKSYMVNIRFKLPDIPFKIKIIQFNIIAVNLSDFRSDLFIYFFL